MPTNRPERYRRYRRYLGDIRYLYQKKQARVYTGIVLSLLTIAFFGYFAIRPTLVTISGLLKEIKDKKEVIIQMDQKISDLSKAQANYSQLSNNLYLVDQSLPRDPSLPVLIKQVEALARLAAVNLETVRFDETNLQGEREKKEDQEASFTLALSGSYPNLKQFLNSLDTLRRVVLVESFAFKSTVEEETQLLILTLDAQAYYLTKNQ